MPRTTLGLQPILQAQQRIAPFIPRSPLVRSANLSAHTGADVWLKLECRQPTGSFKVRGALNKIGLLTPEEKARGLVTASAGNHALGVGYAVQSWGKTHLDSCSDQRLLQMHSSCGVHDDKVSHLSIYIHSGCRTSRTHWLLSSIPARSRHMPMNASLVAFQMS